MTNFQKIISDIVAKDPLRQIGVAEKLGVTDAYVSNFVTGTRKLSKKIALKLEEVYGLNSTEMLSIQKREEADQMVGLTDKKAEALNQLKKIQNGKNKNSNEGKVLGAGDVVKIKTYVIPMKGFAGLKRAIYNDQYITEHFEETTTEVPHHLYSPISYRIQSSGNSMPKSIPDNAWVTGVPISEDLWYTYKFDADRVYILFHPYRGILFKHVERLSEKSIKLMSENEDKIEYEDEIFEITEFRKILLAIKVETFI